MSYDEKITSLMAKNIELSNFIILLLQQFGNEVYLSNNPKATDGLKIKKTTLPNGIVRLEVVRATDTWLSY